MSARTAARIWVSGAVASACAAGAASAQLAVDMAIEAVHPDALAMAQAAAPGVDFDSADIEMGENGHVGTVEIAGRDARGRHVEVDLYQDGESWVIEEVEYQLTWAETPDPIKVMLARIFTREWRPTVVERSVRPDGVVYEIEGYNKQNELVEIEADEEGGPMSLSKYNAT